MFQLPSYAPDVNPAEVIWSYLKRGPLANVAFTGFARLLQVIKHGLRKIQRQPALIDGCLAGRPHPRTRPHRIHELKIGSWLAGSETRTDRRIFARAQAAVIAG